MTVPEDEYERTTWKHQTHGREGLILYKAYYDDRAAFTDGPVIRIFGLYQSTILSTEDHNSTDDFYCQWWHAGDSVAIVTKANISKVGRGLTVGKTTFIESLWTCMVDNQLQSKNLFVALTFFPCQKSTHRLQVLTPQKISPISELGICVATAFGHIEPERIIEWVEFQKLMGVGEIHVYNSAVSNDTLNVFQFYSKEGIMKIHNMTSPIKNTCKWCRKLATVSVLNQGCSGG
jgi:hypothetical protein